jgi:hypothetical protein
VQWAGFTAGLSRSFFDYYNSAALNYRSGYMATEDTGDGGWWTWAYTANFGGGFSATLSAEARRMTQIIGQGTSTAAALVGGGALGSGVTSGQGYGGWQVPDIVANLRVDQAWGNAQVMGALHQVNASYYGGATGAAVETNGHPSDAWGWAAGAGLHLNAPFLGSSDYFEGEVNYSQGASRYDNHTPNTVNQLFGTGANQTFGVTSDCVYGGANGTTGTSCLLTTSWSAVLAWEHFYTPQWHESFSGSYGAESYGTLANAILCTQEGGGNGGATVGTAATATAGCNNNWSYWTAGTRLQWDVTKSFYIGVEALYMKYNSAETSNGLIPSTVGVGSTCNLANNNCTVANLSDWSFTLRMHKDFLP